MYMYTIIDMIKTHHSDIPHAVPQAVQLLWPSHKHS